MSVGRTRLRLGQKCNLGAPPRVSTVPPLRELVELEQMDDLAYLDWQNSAQEVTRGDCAEIIKTRSRQCLAANINFDAVKGVDGQDQGKSQDLQLELSQWLLKLSTGTAQQVDRREVGE